MKPLDDDYLSKYVDIFKALSHPTRLCIVVGLMNKKEGMNVTSMQECTNISQSSISQHLRILRLAGILSSERRGTEIFYRIDNDDVKRIIKCAFNI